MHMYSVVTFTVLLIVISELRADLTLQIIQSVNNNEELPGDGNEVTEAPEQTTPVPSTTPDSTTTLEPTITPDSTTTLEPTITLEPTTTSEPTTTPEATTTACDGEDPAIYNLSNLTLDRDRVWKYTFLNKVSYGCAESICSFGGMDIIGSRPNNWASVSEVVNASWIWINTKTIDTKKSWTWADSTKPNIESTFSSIRGLERQMCVKITDTSDHPYYQLQPSFEKAFTFCEG